MEDKSSPSHKFMELESALRCICLSCMWIRDVFQRLFSQEQTFLPHGHFENTSCGRIVIQNNFGHSLTTKFACLNDQWQSYMQDDDSSRNAIKMPCIGKPTKL